MIDQSPFQFDATLAMLVLFRTAALLVGAFLLFLGYALFKLGYFEKAGELQAAWGNRRLVLKQVAPGIFFALFGTVIVSIGIWKPLSVQTSARTPPAIIATLEKAATNQPLSDTERSALASWLLQQTKREFQYYAINPFGGPTAPRI